MEGIDTKRLVFRRQYIIAPQEIECPFQYNRIDLNHSLILYCHLDLPFTRYSKDTTDVILLGDMFDFEDPNKSNRDILKDLIDIDFNNILRRSEKYSGRFVIIFQNEESVMLLPDNTASRKIYYTQHDNKVWFASLPQLLAKIINLKESEIPSKKEFYNSQDFLRLNNSNIGDTTIYDEVFQVLPNYYFNLEKAKVFRFWPNEPLESFQVEKTAKECAYIIKGYMKSITNRYDVMLPITAGKDSRILLASTKDFTEKIFYYINKESRLNDNSNDLRIPKKLLSKLGLKFNVLNPYISIDKEFESIYFSNNSRASIQYLPIIFNYYKNYSSKVNLPGSIASQVFYRFRYRGVEITPFQLAEINKVSNYDFAIEYYKKWISENQITFENCNTHILNMFYWEERIANWGSQIQMEKDIAQEDFNPFNSKILTKLFLSVDYKLLFPPKYYFHKKIIKNLWPQVLAMPINPSFKSKIKLFLDHIGLLNVSRAIKKSLSFFS